MLVPRYRGARDWLPADMARFRRIEDTFRALAARYGYQEVRTPTLEYLHLFTAAGTLSPDQLARVYSFLDWDGWSGERVALRPDGTIPTARLFLESLQAGFGLHATRLCYVEDVFAFSDESGERERWQCGAELLGGDETAADAELLLLACRVLETQEAGPVAIRLSHAGLLKAMLRVLALPPESETAFLDQLIAGHVGEAVRLADGQSEAAARLLPLLFGVEGEGPGFVRNLVALTAGPWPEVAGQLERFLPLTETLTALERPYRIHLALDRGFEYYTGALFHLYVGDVRVGGGGRYDDLLPLLGGGPLAASGFALYVNALLPLLQMPPAAEPHLVVDTRGSALPHAFRLADVLRSEGWAVTLQVDAIPVDGHARVVVEEEGDVVRYRLQDGAGGESAVRDVEVVLQWLRTSLR